MAAGPSRITCPTIIAGTSAPAASGDFESLVRLLKWRTADPRVGRRDMDVQAPGSNIPGISTLTCDGSCASAARCGRRCSPSAPTDSAEFEKYENWAKAA